MQKQIKDYDNFENLISVMLSDELCQKVITGYYYKTIGRGDYCSLDAARKKNQIDELQPEQGRPAAKSFKTGQFAPGNFQG